MSDQLVSAIELERIERFIAAFNAVDDFLQRHLNSSQTFRSAVDAFAHQYPWWPDADSLRLFATLRNFLIHEKTRPFDYPCVPSESATLEIEAIRERLTNPATLGERFEREVLTLTSDQPLRIALEWMNDRGVSRFPIYEKHHFMGLLTENGIARRVAAQIARGESFDASIPIRDVLPRETKRRQFRFADPRTLVAQAAFWFHEETFLEAVLISDKGDEKAPLRGIVTRGDVAGWTP